METRDVFVNDDNFDHMQGSVRGRYWQEKISFSETHGLLMTLTLKSECQ
jgi:hypothetical protein